MLALAFALGACSAARIDNPPPGMVCETIARFVLTAPGAFEFLNDSSTRCRPAGTTAPREGEAPADPAAGKRPTPAP